jgi:hypothetical protein
MAEEIVRLFASVEGSVPERVKQFEASLKLQERWYMLHLNFKEEVENLIREAGKTTNGENRLAIVCCGTNPVTDLLFTFDCR